MRLASLLVLFAGLLACRPNEGGLKVYSSPPAVTLIAPVDGAVFAEGESVAFEAQADDREDDPATLAVRWRSDLDGELDTVGPDGTGLIRFVTANLSPGTHAISVQVQDSDANSALASVSIAIRDGEDAPSLTVRSPAPGDEGVEAEPWLFEVRVEDPQDAPADLLVFFESDLDGIFCEPTPDDEGGATCSVALSVGEHRLSFGVVDTEGNEAIVERDFIVRAGSEIDDDGDGFTESDGDCDDTDPSVRPGGTEVYNGLDDDCDGTTDEGTVGYDDDGDGFSEVDGDCDDERVIVAPDVAEVCDGIDNDCDGPIDEDTSCYDDDGDLFSELEGDCDDSAPSVWPGAAELPDALDNDCDGTVDEGTTLYDDDGDCFCETGACTGSAATGCASLAAGDCNDGDAAISPAASERCDGVDNDCTGIADEATAVDAPVWYLDADTDGFGGPGTTRACAQPAGTFATSTDCDDTSAATYPGAPELPDTADNDCDGTRDEGTVLYDDDGDCACESGTCTGTVATGCASLVSGDCADADAAIGPLASERCDSVDNNCDGTVDENTAVDALTWYRDADADAYGATGTTARACTQPSGFVALAGDCDDTRAATNPGASETCNSIDDDCDGTVDESSATDAPTWYQDGDGDGFGNPSVTQRACSRPTGYVASGTDCNDARALSYPGASEFCNSQDDDCDGTTDESDAVDALTWYRDADADTWGSAATTARACTQPSGYVSRAGDCVDTNGTISPSATETCNSVDDDCDGLTDEGVGTTFYRDADGDGYGSPSVTTVACSVPSGFVTNNTDCNDASAAINPMTVWYRDADGDGFGSASVTTRQCTQPSGHVATGTDCLDSSASAYPGATEVCDSIDNDCDGTSDEQNASGCSTYFYDFDGDTYGVTTTASRCYCAATGYYRATRTGDCYDSNAQANPAATTYRTTNRGDGSFDYNCDSVQTRNETRVYSCSSFAGFCTGSSSGYVGGAAACGVAGTFGTGCSFFSFSGCGPSSTTSLTQSCL